ncbi:MAG: hypothetical protein AAF913_16360 [Pseudomonadota bacterium]
MTRPIALALVLLSAPVAYAACPVPGDLQSGIYVQHDDGSVTFFQASGDSTHTEYVTFADDPIAYRYNVSHIVFLTEFVDHENGSVLPDTRGSLAYTSDPAAALPLEPGKVWQSTVTTTYADGSPPEEERYTLTLGDPIDVVIGECSYQGVALSHLYLADGYRYLLTQNLIPDLGIAIETGYRDFEAPAEIYRPVAISTDPIQPG